MGASLVTYNSQSIDNVNIRSIKSEPMYSQDGKQTAYTKTTYEIYGTVKSSLQNDIPAIQAALMTPRANLKIALNGVAGDFVNITAPDAMGGPLPKDVEFTEIVNSNYATVKFTIEAAEITDCENLNNNNVLTLDYDVLHELDNDLYTRRTITGTVRLKEAASATNPDALRGLVIPPPPEGFKRESASFFVSRDGRSLDFSVVDQELFRKLPNQVTEIQASFSIDVGAAGVFWNENFRAEVTGHKDSDKRELFNAAINLARARISFYKGILKSAVITEHIFENKIELTISNYVADKSASVDGVLPKNIKIFRPIDIASGELNDLGPYGTSLLAATDKVFFSKCGAGNVFTPVLDAMEGNQVKSSENKYGKPALSLGAKDPDQEPDDKDKKTQLSNTQNSKNAYTFYEDVLIYEVDNGYRFLPSSSDAGTGKAYQAFQPVAKSRQMGRATRIGKPPVIPLPNSKRAQLKGLSNKDVISREIVKNYAPQTSPVKDKLLYSTEWDFEVIIDPSAIKQGSTIPLRKLAAGQTPLNPIVKGQDLSR